MALIPTPIPGIAGESTAVPRASTALGPDRSDVTQSLVTIRLSRLSSCADRRHSDVKLGRRSGAAATGQRACPARTTSSCGSRRSHPTSPRSWPPLLQVGFEFIKTRQHLRVDMQLWTPQTRASMLAVGPGRTSARAESTFLSSKFLCTKQGDSPHQQARSAAQRDQRLFSSADERTWMHLHRCRNRHPIPAADRVSVLSNRQMVMLSQVVRSCGG
jgi:hypothetical protein